MVVLFYYLEYCLVCSDNMRPIAVLGDEWAGIFGFLMTQMMIDNIWEATVKQIFTMAMFAIVLTFGKSLVANAEAAGSGNWYLSPSLFYVIADDDRRADDDLGFQIGVGKVLNQRWNIEFSGVFDNLDFETGNGKYQQRGILADGLYMFNREPAMQPFALVGLGALRTKAAGDSNVNPLINIGAGIMFPLSDNGVSLRGDIRHRWDFDDETVNGEDRFNDWLVSIGIAIPFGGTTKSVEPSAAPMSEEVSSNSGSDADNDGVLDGDDKCPNTAANASVDANGCEMDSDNDSVVDSKDKCPGTASGVNVDEKGCELDNDKDGVANHADECPSSSMGAVVDIAGCELDGDNDGVVDSKDSCKNTPAGAKVGVNGCELDGDNDGVADNNDDCPNSAANVNVDIHGCELQNTFVLKGVKFVTGSDKLTPEATVVLDDVAATLIKNAGITVEIAGYTDNTGKASFNRSLSQQRAESVKRYLVNAGVSSESLIAKGYGISDPIADNSTKSGRAANRRVEMHIQE